MKFWSNLGGGGVQNLKLLIYYDAPIQTWTPYTPSIWSVDATYLMYDKKQQKRLEAINI